MAAGHVISAGSTGAQQFSVDVVECVETRRTSENLQYNEFAIRRSGYIKQETLFTCVSYAEARNRYRLDVRPSVRPSVTRWYCIKTSEYIAMLSSPHDSPFILVLCIERSSRNSDGVTPCGGAKYRWGIKICAIFYQ